MEDLPDYSKVSFPNMPPLDLHLLLPNAHADDVAFLRTLLCLAPHERATARVAMMSSYFSQAPFPCPASPVLLPATSANRDAPTPEDLKLVHSVEDFRERIFKPFVEKAAATGLVAAVKEGDRDS